ncbi:MAG: hypothetical protein FWD17_03800 [Polyangiaceae bacterium]|nr:hypothetical protein [Polyangiaceae bacterium]
MGKRTLGLAVVLTTGASLLPACSSSRPGLILDDTGFPENDAGGYTGTNDAAGDMGINDAAVDGRTADTGTRDTGSTVVSEDGLWTSCSTDDDCVGVYFGNVCGFCSTSVPNGAIAVSAKSAYADALNRAEGNCPPITIAGLCVEPRTITTCAAGACVLTTCPGEVAGDHACASTNDAAVETDSGDGGEEDAESTETGLDGAIDGQSSDAGQEGGTCVPFDAPTTTLPDLDTPCYGGATGQQLLDLVAPTYAAQFTPQGAPAGYTFSGSLAPTALTLTFTYTGGPAQCDPPLPNDCDIGDPDAGVTSCPCRLGNVVLPFDVTFQTADGAFNEQFVVSASLKTDFGESVIQWQATVPASQLHGTYPPIFSPSETIGFEGTLEPTGYDEGIVFEQTDQASGGGGSWQ